MSLASRTIITLLAGLVAVPMTPVTHTSPNAPAGADVPVAYASSRKEAFLAPDQVTYVRPGLNIKIASITNFAPGQKPVVEFFVTDDIKGPLDRLGLVTPGVISFRFVPALWDPATRRYTNYIVSGGNPSRDTTGTFQDFETGHYKYTFANALPATMDASKAHTLYMGAVRNTTDIIGKNYYAVPQYQDFIPATNAVATTFNATTIGKCNQCHDPLAPHGGNYRDIKTCVLCHNPNNMTGANTHFDGEIFFHALHQGKDSTIGPITYPQDIRNCANCHDAKSAGGASWYTYPSRAACGSCHNDLNFTTGKNHEGGVQLDDQLCASCHVPTVELPDVDAPIQVAHTVPYKSDQLHGLVMKIVSVTRAAPGQKPVVKFQITDRGGVSMDPRPFDTLRFTLGGPTTDYSSYISEDAQATTTFDGTTATYTFQAPVPATAKNTWMLTSDVEVAVIIKRPPLSDITDFTESPLNPIFYIAMTDKTAVPRRTVVDIAKCNVCHDRLGAHGGQRLVTQGCVVCHNPVNDDSSQRPPSAGSAESIDMRRMIHRIHTGDQLEQDFTVFGHGAREVNFNDVTYPGDRRNCTACHTTLATAAVPTAATLNVVTERDFFSPMGPGTAACTGCHDSRDVVSHAFINTSFFPKNPTVPAEACGTCHGSGADLDVARVHAR